MKSPSGSGVVEQFAQLLPIRPDRGRAYRATGCPGQAVQGTRMVTRQPHRVPDAGVAIRQGDFLQAEDGKSSPGRQVADIDSPGQRAIGTGFRLLRAEQGILHRGPFVLKAPSCSQRQAMTWAMAETTDGHALALAMRRHLHVEESPGVLARASSFICNQPWSLARMSMDRSWRRRPGRAVRPGRWPTLRTAARPSGSTWPTNSANCRSANRPCRSSTGCLRAGSGGPASAGWRAPGPAGS